MYVEEGQGVPFFGGKQLYELDPTNKKYLSTNQHNKRIQSDLKLVENMVLISRSGTIGKINIVAPHWQQWIANEHIIRIEVKNKSLAGYLYLFLATEYGHTLIQNFTYGAVVDEIDDKHVAQIPFPLLHNQDAQLAINNLALKANELRAEAYHAEQAAIRIMNEEVIHAAS